MQSCLCKNFVVRLYSQNTHKFDGEEGGGGRGAPVIFLDIPLGLSIHWWPLNPSSVPDVLNYCVGYFYFCCCCSLV